MNLEQAIIELENCLSKVIEIANSEVYHKEGHPILETNLEDNKHYAKYFINAWKDVLVKDIINFLRENNLQVINTKDQLLGFCSEDVSSYYIQKLEHYQEEYGFNIPETLTQKQAQDLLELADTLNSKHDLGFYWDDIDEAINQWLSENYDSKIT